MTRGQLSGDDPRWDIPGRARTGMQAVLIDRRATSGSAEAIRRLTELLERL